MKILQISYSLSPGGAERLVVDLSNEFARQGHDVTLCILLDDTIKNYGFYKSEISEKVKYINLSIPVGLRLNNIGLLFRLIKRIDPQVVHCHLNLVNYVFPLTLYFTNIKFFHTIHSDASKEVKYKIEYRIRRYFYKSLKMKAVTISAETSGSFRSYYEIPPFKEIINGRANPKQSDAFNEVKSEIQILKEKENTIFLHIGRCDHVKNQKMLISVINRVLNDWKNIVLLIIGSGFDSEEGQELRKLANTNIFFLGEKKNVSDYLLNADAFCLSSSIEGMPISLIEALSCGCVPICTPVGGIINTIEDGKTGYLSKTPSENDYFNTIIRYLSYKDLIRREDLIHYYHSYFSIEKCANEYLSLYKD